MRTGTKYLIYVLLLIASILFSVVIPIKLHSGKVLFFHDLTLPEIVVILGFLITSWINNATRLRILSRRVGQYLGFIDASLLVGAMVFASVATPWGLGMPVALTYLLEKHGLKLGRAAAVFAAISLLDSLFVTALILGTAIPLFLSGGFALASDMAASALGMIALIVFIVFILFGWYRRLFLCIGRQLGRNRWLAKRRIRFARTVIEFIRAMRLLREMSALQRFGVFLTTVGFWLPRYAVPVFIIYAIGSRVPIPYILLVEAALDIGTLILFTPGGSGGVDAGYTVLMSPYLNAPQLAFTLLVWRSANFFWYLAVGIPIFVYEIVRKPGPKPFVK